MRRKARVDSNHSEIIQEFRRKGWEVHDTSRLGGGFPDLVAYSEAFGILQLVEVKDGSKSPSRRKLTDAESEFSEKFPVLIVTRPEEVPDA